MIYLKTKIRVKEVDDLGRITYIYDFCGLAFISIVVPYSLCL